jgi:RNA polymerase sigma-70 factor (ECF subfamily)
MHADAHTPASEPDERELLAALRGYDEAAFGRFVDQHHGALVRFALVFTGDAAAAETLAQETWAAFVTSLARVPSGSRLKTWLFRSLLGCAGCGRSRTLRSASRDLDARAHAQAAPSVDPARFMTEGVWAGGWSAPPCSFGELGEELRPQLSAALQQLPASQRQVTILRDVEGFSAQEVSELLDLTEPQQRALLHRGRAQLRSALEHYFEQRAGSV